MTETDFTKGIKFFNEKHIIWGTKIERLIKDWRPKKDIQGDRLKLIWGDVKFYGSVLTAASEFFPEETLVKDRFLKEIILSGQIEPKKHVDIINGINSVVGDPTGHVELPNLSSYNWMHDEIEVSANYILKSQTVKVSIRKI